MLRFQLTGELKRAVVAHLDTTLNLRNLIADGRTTLREDVIDAQAFCQDIRHLQFYGFWESADNAPGLWEHQQTAIGTVVAYLNGDKSIPERPEQIEAALLKLPTGTGKSGIVAVLARCLLNVTQN